MNRAERAFFDLVVVELLPAARRGTVITRELVGETMVRLLRRQASLAARNDVLLAVGREFHRQIVTTSGCGVRS